MSCFLWTSLQRQALPWTHCSSGGKSTGLDAAFQGRTPVQRTTACELEARLRQNSVATWHRLATLLGSAASLQRAGVPPA